MKTLKYLFVAAAFMSASSTALSADLPRGPMPQPVVMSAPSHDDFSGLYLRGDIGVGTSNIGSVTRSAAAVTSYTQDFNEVSPNTNIGIGIGYAWNSWFRTDATLEYRGGAQASGRYRFATAGGLGLNDYRANLSQTVGLVNAYVDLGTYAGITPFLGAGIGFANNRLGTTSSPGTWNCGACITPTSEMISAGSKTNLAWALMAGLSYDVTRTAKLEMGYRYLNTGSYTSGTTSTDLCGCVSTSSPLVGGKIAAHDFRLGMRWMLGSTTPTQVAQAPLMRRF